MTQPSQPEPGQQAGEITNYAALELGRAIFRAIDAEVTVRALQQQLQVALQQNTDLANENATLRSTEKSDTPG